MTGFDSSFEVTQAPVRVRFGAGARQDLGSEVERLGAQRALVLTTPEQAGVGEEVLQSLGPLGVGLFAEARMHTPVAVTERAVAVARELLADCLLSVGGGSTTGLGKAIAYRTGLPQIVLPTTYAGSEATAILGQTETGRKTTLTDPRAQPEVIIYDPELVVGLPVDLSVTSALNAMAHAAEALYAQNRNPLSSTLALEGLRAFIEARAQTLYGAWLCGTVLNQVGMALHHKLCHTLGGSFDLPHAPTHAIILPHAVAYNEVAVPELLAPLAELLGDRSAGMALYDFARRVGAPTALRDLGLEEDALDEAAALAIANPYWNPRPLHQAALRELLQAAWEGRPPKQ